MKQFSITLLLTFGLLVLTSCKSSDPPNLPGNCSINRRDTGVYDIVGPSKTSTTGLPIREVLVDADVEKIAVIGGVVMGYCKPYAKSGDIGTSGGYFCLDTDTKKIKEGMTLADYEKYLRSVLNIKKKPQLKTWRRY